MSETPRVSVNFPRVPAICEKVAEPFFSCLYEHGKQPKEKSDPLIGSKAMQTCRESMEAYNTCVDAAVIKAPKTLFRVPEAYRVRDQ